MGRCAWSVLYLLDLLPWMRDVHPWFTRGRAWRTRSFRIIVIIWCVSLSARSVVVDTFDSQKGVLAQNDNIDKKFISREGKEHVYHSS